MLLVEDEDKIASFIVKGLSAVGYETERRDGGRGDRAGPGADVMVLDLGLPGLDGIEVLQRIPRADLEPQVIVLTARPSSVTGSRGWGSGPTTTS